MEKDTAVIYELQEAVIQEEDSIGDLQEEKCDLPFPYVVNENDECLSKVSALKEREKHGHQKQTITPNQREAAETNLKSMLLKKPSNLKRCVAACYNCLLKM